ncbi:MAG: 2-oxo acid dehydrogenase subunit E2 [Ruminococcaceae bacterium]|nr:2-oxo acid dehydrogenase subunit E2 [Oscillospiraceae bacterium]
MATAVIMPRQGQSVESCIITSWNKAVGDTVAEGDVLFSYETDKSAFDEVATVSGTMLAQLYSEGDVVVCLENVCVIGEPGEDISAFTGGAAAPADEAPKAEEAAPAADTAPAAHVEEAAPAAEITADAGRIFISPRAKNLALKTGVDMTKVAPTGPHGRIIERDIEKALDAGFKATAAAVEDFLAGKIAIPAAEEAAPAVAAAAPAVVEAEYTEIPMSGIRKAIARSMTASLSEMAQLTLNASFDATDILAYRKKLKAAPEDMGVGKITLNDIVLYAVSRVLPKYPFINANLVDNTIRSFTHANVGMAVDTERGLLVPTLRAADTMSLAEISAMAKTMAGKAKDGGLTPDEMSGGSFTVTNLGSLGVESFTPVINPPQTAILGVCTTVNRLRADGTVYPAMGLSLTFDHRVVDGAPAAKFLKELCDALENFSLLLAK